MPSEAELIESCLAMVRYFARRLVPRDAPIEFEDGVSEGYVGLVRAARAFDPERGVAFSTFAAISIRGAIIDALRRATPVSRRRSRDLRLVDQARVRLAVELGRDPEDAEVARHLGLDPARLDRLRGQPPLRLLSIDQQHEGADLDPADPESTEDAAIRLLEAQEVWCFVEGLTPREREVIQRRYARGQSQKEIAIELGLSESRICQLHKRALARLRSLMEPRERAA